MPAFSFLMLENEAIKGYFFYIFIYMTVFAFRLHLQLWEMWKDHNRFVGDMFSCIFSALFETDHFLILQAGARLHSSNSCSDAWDLRVTSVRQLVCLRFSGNMLKYCWEYASLKYNINRTFTWVLCGNTSVLFLHVSFDY